MGNELGYGTLVRSKACPPCRGPAASPPCSLSHAEAAQCRAYPGRASRGVDSFVSRLSLQEQLFGHLILANGRQDGGSVLTCSGVIDQPRTASGQSHRIDQWLGIVVDEPPAPEGDALHGGDLGSERRSSLYRFDDAPGDVVVARQSHGTTLS